MALEEWWIYADINSASQLYGTYVVFNIMSCTDRPLVNTGI